MPSVTVVDYGIGNLLSVKRAFEYCGAEVVITDSIEKIENAERLVLPGVGAFKDGMDGLRKRRLIEPIKKFAKKNRPFMGICLGMQMMMEYGEEFGNHEGLGLIPGKVVKIQEINGSGVSHKIPHIGWNELIKPAHQSWEGTILHGIEKDSAVYFVHSFSAKPIKKENNLADCSYNGLILSAVICEGLLFGCQFHPEKSGQIGLKIIKNFINLSTVV